MRFLIILVLTISSLFSQIKIVDLTAHSSEYSFDADKISVNSTGYYLLDSDDRQLMFIDKDGSVYTAGGYGTTEDSFIDPIDILVSKLKVYVIDGTENNIAFYDYKLNYLRTMNFEEIYPSLCGVDDWENIYLYSKNENKIFKLIDGQSSIIDFIDLASYNINEKSIDDIIIANNGDISILSDESLTVFNRLGNIVIELPLANKYNFIFMKSNNWYGIDQYNNILNLKYNDQHFSLSDKEILDIDYFNDHLYILLKNQIWIVDVELE